jgi:hypothetical protein
MSGNRCGSTAWRARSIERMRERTGFGILVALLQFGILPDDLTRRNMELSWCVVVDPDGTLVERPATANIRAR